MQQCMLLCVYSSTQASCIESVRHPLLPFPQADNVSLLPTFYAEDTPASANETWARLHNDPLFSVSVQTVLTES